MEHEPGARPPAWVDSVHVTVLIAVTVVLAVLVGVVLATSGPSRAGTPDAGPTAPATSAAPPPAAQPSPAEVELRAEAARLTAPIRLTAPAGWAGRNRTRPARDIDGCPHLAARLGPGLGSRLTYWHGTLPRGPYGCSWVPAPVTDGGPDAYDYVLDVGWLDDGTTPAALGSAQGGSGGSGGCADVGVPAVGPDAVLVRCQVGAGVEYSLVLRDSGGAGVWLLHARARSTAPRSAGAALDLLVAAASTAYAPGS